MKKNDPGFNPPWKRFGFHREERASLTVMLQELRVSFMQLDNKEFDKYISEKLNPDDPAHRIIAFTRQNSLIASAILVGFLEKFLGVTPIELKVWDDRIAAGKPPVGVRDHQKPAEPLIAKPPKEKQ